MKKKNSKKTKGLNGYAKGGIIGGLLIALGAVLLLIFLGNTAVTENQIERIIDYGKTAQGVSVNGIDISDMTEEQAMQATAAIDGDLLANAVFSMDVDGEVTELGAEDLGLFTDYESVIKEAMGFGRTGDFDKRKQELETAKTQGKDFEVKVCADEGLVTSAISQFKSSHDIEATGAGYEFMPWGYFEADGTKYEPTEDELNNYMDTISKKKDYEMPEGLVRIIPENMPKEIRYQFYVGKKNNSYYYREKHDNEVYMPDSANIARFKYTEEAKGIDINAGETVDLIMAAVEAGEFSTIEVPADITHTESKIEDAMYDTQLITSWSSFLSHDDTPRVYNVAKLSSIINGVVLLPGETWSVNDTTGNRTDPRIWKNAPGYTDGLTIDQPGGGVCQVSSTLYNAALRAGLKYDEDISSRRHSRVSDYISIGLDATISTPSGPDLKLTNPYDTPLYIVSYMSGSDKCVTVEIYGRPPVDAAGKELIYNFTSKHTGTGDMPKTYYHHDMTQTPDGTPIPEGGYIEYRSARAKEFASVYKTVYDIDGNIVEAEQLYYKWTYPSSIGEVYCNFPEPLVSGDPLVPDPPPEVPGDGTEGEPGDTTNPGAGNNGNHTGQN